ncbi:MAG: outer rane chaperone Skp (OmpH) [Bacteroidetes bacterium]|nr:outer rane chaperone Skp (OmpH) [Bacteroidota bacterium]
MKKTFIPAIVILALFGVAGQAQAQKIGYVNSTKIFQEYPAALDAQKKIDAIGRPFQDSLEAMQKDLQARYEDYQKKESMMNDASKRTEQQKLVEMERRANEYRVEKFGQDGELARQTEKIINPIREKIKSAIASVAKEEKYSFVFDKTEQIQVLLYGDPNQDITFKVIDKLKRGK